MDEPVGAELVCCFLKECDAESEEEIEAISPLGWHRQGGRWHVDRRLGRYPMWRPEGAQRFCQWLSLLVQRDLFIPSAEQLKMATRRLSPQMPLLDHYPSRDLGLLRAHFQPEWVRDQTGLVPLCLLGDDGRAEETTEEYDFASMGSLMELELTATLRLACSAES